MPHTSATISLATALAHEALYPRLEALLKQVEVLARRRPESPVVPEVMGIAETLFIEARRFGGPAGRTRKFHQTTTNAGLLARLAQARAALDAFESDHAPWDPVRKCFAWRLETGGSHPVARLRPEVAPEPEVRPEPPDIKQKRAKIARHLDSFYERGYRDGFRDGSGGAEPPQAPRHYFSDGQR